MTHDRFDEGPREVRRCALARPFPSVAPSVSEIRAWTRVRLAACEVRPTVLDIAVLLVSEVATNAIVHAEGRSVTVRLIVAEDLEVAVHDADAAARPCPGRPGPNDTGGRGLALVDALAADWGMRGAGSGKWVWFRLPLAVPALLAS